MTARKFIPIGSPKKDKRNNRRGRDRFVDEASEFLSAEQLSEMGRLSDVNIPTLIKDVVAQHKTLTGLLRDAQKMLLSGTVTGSSDKDVDLIAIQLQRASTGITSVLNNLETALKIQKGLAHRREY